MGMQWFRRYYFRIDGKSSVHVKEQKAINANKVKNALASLFGSKNQELAFA